MSDQENAEEVPQPVEPEVQQEPSEDPDRSREAQEKALNEQKDAVVADNEARQERLNRTTPHETEADPNPSDENPKAEDL